MITEAWTAVLFPWKSILFKFEVWVVIFDSLPRPTLGVAEDSNTSIGFSIDHMEINARALCKRRPQQQRSFFASSSARRVRVNIACSVEPIVLHV